MNAPSADLQSRVGKLVGKRPVSWRRATGGYSQAHRWIVSFEDGSSCFMKGGASKFTANAIRAEFDKVYSQIDAEFLAGGDCIRRLSAAVARRPEPGPLAAALVRLTRASSP
jgi:hypothetical protein